MKPNRTAAIFWIWLCAWLNVAGWTLSALHELNVAGYAAAFLIFILGFAIWKNSSRAEIFSVREIKKILRRFCRLPSGIFLLIAILAFIGGVIYAPGNFDALTYRLPRMLNWLTAGHWFWISTFNERMNYSGVGWEWTAMPFFALLRSDRAMFLLDAASFFLMPGLLFSIFRQLGVARKTAWHWMWLVPLAYGFATQAGSIGNDLFGAIFLLLSVDFGLRARKSGCILEIWCALLAAALLTGVKLSNLPLALPCIVAIWPTLKFLRKNLAGTFLVLLMAILISALPIMYLNQKNAGGWNGDPQNKYNMQIKNPVVAFLGNGILLAQEVFLPPVLPESNRINNAIINALPDWFNAQFPRLRTGRMNELPGEEGASISPVITLPILIAIFFSLAKFRSPNALKKLLRLFPPVILAVWISTLFYMAKMGSEAGPRLMLPYFPLALVPFFLLAAQSDLLRRRWWRIFLSLLALMTLPVIIFSVTRPLFPVEKIASAFSQMWPANQFWRHAAQTYPVYAHRNDFLAAMREPLDANHVREIGFIANSNDSDYSLWRPIGTRVVKYPRADIEAFLKNPQLKWVVVKENVWAEISAQPLSDWARLHGAQIVFSTNVTELVSWGPEKWSLLHFENVAQKKF